MCSDEVRIVEASAGDLDRLYPLVAGALPYDSLSPGLVAEKLFFNPHPGRDVYCTLIAEDRTQVVGMLHHVVRAETQSAWLGLFAVADAYRRRGIASRLYEKALASWRAQKVHTVEVLTIPTNYLVPGIDPRYTPAVCFVESRGFQKTGEAINMRARLDGDFDTSAEQADLASQGVEIRRAGRQDDKLIDEFFARYFGEGWLAEARQAMRREPPALHLAIEAGAIIGFAAHSTLNVEHGHFGPMGTADEARGRGIGRVLLFRVLADLKAAGFNSVVIPWVGPYAFYARLLDCAIERCFWRYRLELDG